MHYQETEHITGSIERITFHSPESGFCVLRVKAKTHKDLITVVGQAACINAGEYIEATGMWITDKNHGLQFKAKHLQTIPPASLEGIIKYLGSGLIKGIGPHFAKKLVEAFGADVLTIIECEPERLRELPGIGDKRCSKIITSWAEQKVIRNIMVFLQSHGVGTARAVRIYKTYGDSAIDKVRENPYRLALDIHGIGFKTADELAKKLGIEPHSLMRARSGVQHVLQELCSNGHCAIVVHQLIQSSVELLDIPESIIQCAIEEELKTEQLIATNINNETCIALVSLYRAELGIAEQLHRLFQAHRPRWFECNTDKAITWVEQQTNLTLSASQKEAVSKAIHAKVMILTGGPGVGKTTVINSILRIIKEYGANITLCAPTGRAAKRMTESTGMEAKTIHRLLELDAKTMQFRYNQDNPLITDYIVIDESSMVDVVLMNQLLKAIPSKACLLIVGDVDQLPSVGPGAVLSNLIHSQLIPTVRLSEIFRQAATSKIIVNAHRINQGSPPIIDNAEKTDFYFIDAETPEQAHEIIIKLATSRVPLAFSLHPINDIQILSPMQRGTLGVRGLNNDLQQALNTNVEPKITRFSITFAPGDKVIQTVNNYDKEVFNGDVGRVHLIDLEEGLMQIDFEGKLVDYSFDELDEINLAYAITIHKSQGSEYPAVIIPLCMQHYSMLARNLLYTGVTRGKKLVIIVGQKKALAMAVKNFKSLQRLTTLPQHLVNSACKGL